MPQSVMATRSWPSLVLLGNSLAIAIVCMRFRVVARNDTRAANLAGCQLIDSRRQFLNSQR